MADHTEVLHRIDKRLARVEERLKDLNEIKADIKSNNESLSLLKVKVGGVSASVALVTTALIAGIRLWLNR